MFHYVFFVHKAAILQGEGLIAQDLTSSWIIHEPGQKSRGEGSGKVKMRGREVKFCLKILLQICEKVPKNFFKNAIFGGGRVAFNKHFRGENGYIKPTPLNLCTT